MFCFSTALTPSPFIPLPLRGKGEVVLRGGEAPSFLFLPLSWKERGIKGVRCRKRY